MLNDEMTSPKGKGPYFSLPDYTSRVFGCTLAELAQDTLLEMTKFEAKKLNTVRRPIDEARQLTDFHNHPEVVSEWERSDQEDEDYAGPEWFYGALASFVFSVKCLYGTYKHLKEFYPDFDPKVIIDWGAGLGLHSLICAHLWPNSKVYYYNVPGLQTQFAKEWVKPEFGVENMIIKTNPDNLPKKADLIICYEVLEHLKKPVEGTYELLSHDPEFVSVSFSFTAPCHGHYTEFIVDNEYIPREEVTRYVNDVFREKCVAVGHGWNARPVLWQKK